MPVEQVSSSDIMYLCDPQLEKAEICGKYVGNNLSVHLYSPDKQIVATKENTDFPCVYHITVNGIIYNSAMRKLVNESCFNFLSGQSLKNMLTTTCRPELVKLSRKYRSTIRSCMESLQQEIKCKVNDVDCEVNIIAILYNIEFIWHLTEILHIEAVSDDTVISRLVEWLNLHYPEAEKQAVNMLNNSKLNQEITINGIESHYSDFWDVLINLSLQGNLDLIRALLKLHSSADTEMFIEADKALRKMPKLSMYETIPMSEYVNIWKSWHASVKDKIRIGLFSSEKHLESIMKIIIGDASMISYIKPYCNTWYKYMIVTLLYSEPTFKSYDLSYHAHQCISQYGGISRMKTFDTIMVALLDSDLKLAAGQFQLIPDCGWTAVHMTNLLRLCGKLNFEGNIATSSLRVSPLEEQFLREYGSLLVKHDSLWQIGIHYLDNCPSSGLAYVEAVLPFIPVQTEAKAIKILDIARDRNLTAVVNHICRIQGQKCIQEHRLGDALTWAFRSQNSAFASKIADEFLHSYIHVGYFNSTDVLDSLGSCILLSDRLVFLGKYYDFHQLYITGKLKEAASLLSQLLESKLVPKFFLPTLLLDAVPLLENGETTLLSTSQIQNLMFSLEELLREKSPHYIVQQKSRIIRMALMKNLAQSFTSDLCNNRAEFNGFVLN